jgi:hypothetical protein
MAPVTYTVEVTREGDAWIADVIDLPGAHTFARNLTALDDAVHEVIALVTDAPDDADRPPLHYVYAGVDETFLEAAKLGEAREDIEARQRQLTLASAVAAARLAAAGYSVRDIAGALKLTPGRVSQILNADPRPTAAAVIEPLGGTAIVYGRSSSLEDRFEAELHKRSSDVK